MARRRAVCQSRREVLCIIQWVIGHFLGAVTFMALGCVVVARANASVPNCHVPGSVARQRLDRTIFAPFPPAQSRIETCLSSCRPRPVWFVAAEDGRTDGLVFAGLGILDCLEVSLDRVFCTNAAVVKAILLAGANHDREPLGLGDPVGRQQLPIAGGIDTTGLFQEDLPAGLNSQ